MAWRLRHVSKVMYHLFCLPFFLATKSSQSRSSLIYFDYASYTNLLLPQISYFNAVLFVSSRLCLKNGNKSVPPVPFSPDIFPFSAVATAKFNPWFPAGWYFFDGLIIYLVIIWMWIFRNLPSSSTARLYASVISGMLVVEIYARMLVIEET